MKPLIILSHFQATVLLTARKEGRASATVSVDLGFTPADVPVAIIADGVNFADSTELSWKEVERIAKNEAAAFSLQDGKAEQIYVFSKAHNRAYSLRPTAGAPTMLMASFPMHRIKEIDPQEDTQRKIATISPMLGTVLDTTTGLGYTAIAASRTADHVTTIELDPAALRIAGMNPWSQELFDNPKIEQRIGSAFDIVPTLPHGVYTRIIHDPPAFTLAGELYSGEFYQQLFRVLHPRGQLFHYIGDLDSRSGRVVSKGVVRRLQESGFSKIVRRPEAFGLVAVKNFK